MEEKYSNITYDFLRGDKERYGEKAQAIIAALENRMGKDTFRALNIQFASMDGISRVRLYKSPFETYLKIVPIRGTAHEIADECCEAIKTIKQSAQTTVSLANANFLSRSFAEPKVALASAPSEISPPTEAKPQSPELSAFEEQHPNIEIYFIDKTQKEHWFNERGAALFKELKERVGEDVLRSVPLSFLDLVMHGVRIKTETTGKRYIEVGLWRNTVDEIVGIIEEFKKTEASVPSAAPETSPTEPRDFRKEYPNIKIGDFDHVNVPEGSEEVDAVRPAIIELIKRIDPETLKSVPIHFIPAGRPRGEAVKIREEMGYISVDARAVDNPEQFARDMKDAIEEFKKTEASVPPAAPETAETPAAAPVEPEKHEAEVPAAPVLVQTEAPVITPELAPISVDSSAIERKPVISERAWRRQEPKIEVLTPESNKREPINPAQFEAPEYLADKEHFDPLRKLLSEIAPKGTIAPTVTIEYVTRERDSDGSINEVSSTNYHDILAIANEQKKNGFGAIDVRGPLLDSLKDSAPRNIFKDNRDAILGLLAEISKGNVPDAYKEEVLKGTILGFHEPKIPVELRDELRKDMTGVISAAVERPTKNEPIPQDVALAAEPVPVVPQSETPTETSHEEKEVDRTPAVAAAGNLSTLILLLERAQDPDVLGAVNTLKELQIKIVKAELDAQDGVFREGTLDTLYELLKILPQKFGIKERVEHFLEEESKKLAPPSVEKADGSKESIIEKLRTKYPEITFTFHPALDVPKLEFSSESIAHAIEVIGYDRLKGYSFIVKDSPRAPLQYIPTSKSFTYGYMLSTIEIIGFTNEFLDILEEGKPVPVDTKATEKSVAERDGANETLISSATTLEELYANIRMVGSIVGDDGKTYTPDVLIRSIVGLREVRRRIDEGRIKSETAYVVGLNWITNTHGLRDKVDKLIREEQLVNQPVSAQEAAGSQSNPSQPGVRWIPHGTSEQLPKDASGGISPEASSAPTSLEASKKPEGTTRIGDRIKEGALKVGEVAGEVVKEALIQRKESKELGRKMREELRRGIGEVFTKKEKLKELTPEEQESQVFAGFEKHFGVKKAELAAMPEFQGLSLGQKAFLLQNLEQLTLGEIEKRGLERARNERRDAAGIIKRGWRGAFARYYTVKAEGEIAKEMRGKIEPEGEGVKIHGEMIKTLARQLDDADLDVRIQENNPEKLEVMYVGKDIRAGVESDPKKLEAINKFEKAAATFAKTRPEWTYHAAKGREKAEKARKTFEDAKRELMGVLLETAGADTVLSKFAGIERRVRMDQLFHAEPNIEEQLDGVQSKWVWLRALQSVALERGGYFALGAVRRTATAAAFSSLGILAAPAVGLVAGGVMARHRAIRALKEEALLMTSGEKARVIKGKKGKPERPLIIEGGFLYGADDTTYEIPMGGQEKSVEWQDQLKKEKEDDGVRERVLLNVVKANILAEKLMPTTTKWKERAGRKNMTPEQRKARILYTMTKLESGLIDFGGTPEERIKNYDLLATALANATVDIEVKATGLDSRLRGSSQVTSAAYLESFMGMKEGGVTKHVWKETGKGALWGVGAGAAGVAARYGVRSLIDLWHGSAAVHAPQGMGVGRSGTTGGVAKVMGVHGATNPKEPTMPAHGAGTNPKAASSLGGAIEGATPGSEKLELVKEFLPKEMQQEFHLDPGGAIVRDGYPGTYHISRDQSGLLTMIHEVPKSGDMESGTKECFDTATNEFRVLDTGANKLLEEVQAASDAPRVVIEHNGSAWGAAQQLMKEGKITKEQFNAAWSNPESTVLARGQEIHISKLGLTHPGDEVRYIAGTAGKSGHFEMCTQDESRIGSDSDLREYYEKAKIDIPSWLKESVESEQVIKAFPDKVRSFHEVMSTTPPLGGEALVSELTAKFGGDNLASELAIESATANITVSGVFAEHLREAGFATCIPGIANQIEDINMHAQDLSLAALEDRLLTLRPLLSDLKEFEGANAINEDYGMLARRMEYSIGELQHALDVSHERFAKALLKAGIHNVPYTKEVVKSNMTVGEFLARVGVEDKTLPGNFDKILKFIKPFKPTLKEYRIPLDRYLKDHFVSGKPFFGLKKV